MATGRKRTVEEQVRDRKIEKEVALGVERKMKRARHNKKHNLLRAKKAKAEKKQREEIVPVEASAQRKLRAQQREQLAKKAVTQESRELARRELARRDLIRFSKRFMPAYDPGWVHEDIATRLVQFMKDIEDKKSPRLMLFMPPRHGKSQLASIFFPAFLLGHHPEFEIIASSYAVSLPLGFSRKVKALIETAGYQALFPKTKLNKNSQAAEAWLTTEAGGYVAAGVGGGITGKGSHCFIIDDPVKDAQEADSETTRASTWDWWGSTAKTRLAPGGGVLCIQTRWHDDDLSGKLISQQHQQEAELGELIEDAEHRLALLTRTSDEARKTYSELEMYKAELATIDRWEVVSFPAIAIEPEFRHADTREIKRVSEFESPELIPDGFELLRDINEPLHESRFPWHRLMNMKRSMQPRHWSALYQQNPVPDEGEYFQKSMFRSTHGVVDTKGMHVYAAWDLAIGQKQTNDFTVGVVVALDHNDIIHILDVVRFRGDSFAIVEAILDVENRYSPVLTGIEKGHLEMAIKPQMDRRVRERKLYPTFAEGKEALVPITDKILRARPLQGRMQQGMVHFPANQPWVETLQQEMLRFPGGVHDDQVDALAWVVRLLLKRTAPSAHGKVRKIKSWKDRLPGLMRGARTPMGA